MTHRTGLLLIILACAASPSLAQATGAVLPSAIDAAPGESFMVEVRVDVTATGQELGSYGAVLTWDPAVLQYTGTTAGPAPFDAPVINASAASTGILSLAEADATGMPGDVTIFLVTFNVVGYPCDIASVALSMTSLHAAVTLDDLLPLGTIQNTTVSVEEHLFDLQAFNPGGTILAWNAIPGAASYDVIRFSPAGLYQDANTVHLGNVTCWEDDSMDATTGAGTEPANPDTDALAPGQAFFYLVRGRYGGSNSTYGFTGACARERVADAFDCP